jgi:hypothetical protein
MSQQMRIALGKRSLYYGTMKTAGTIVFKLQQKVDGEEVTPSNINFSDFLRFNREVADFIVGKGNVNLLLDAHPEIDKGSYVVKVALSAVLLQLVEPDYEKLQAGSSLSGMDIKRLAVVDRWQKRSPSRIFSPSLCLLCLLWLKSSGFLPHPDFLFSLC